MNFDKESKSDYFLFFFFFGGGGGGGGEGGCRSSNLDSLSNRYLLIFCAHALYKISSSWLKWFSSFNANKRSNGQVRGITLPMFCGIQSKVTLTWILNNLVNIRIRAQAILDVLCSQGFSIVIKAKSKMGITRSTFYRIRPKLNQVI